MKILFCIAAVLAIREINAAATGAVVRVDQRVENAGCPHLSGDGNANDDDVTDGKMGCYKLYCHTDNGWQANKTYHCNCCVAYNDPHVLGLGNATHRVGTSNYGYEFMEKCKWNLFMKHVGNVTEGDMKPNGTGVTSLFANFLPCIWANSSTCIRDTTFTLKRGMNRLQIKFELLDSSQSVMINTIMGVPAPSVDSKLLPPYASTYSRGTTIALIYEFKTQSDAISCVRCIWQRGMIVVCPNLLIFFYRPDSDPLTNDLHLFGMCGRWTNLADNGHTIFQNPFDSTDEGEPANHTEFIEWMTHWYYCDEQENDCDADLHNVTLYTERRDSGKYIVSSEETCQGYKNHVDVCTKTVNKYGRELPESQRQDSIKSCVTDMCGVTRSARNDEQLQKGLNKWVKVAAEVAEVRSTAG